MKDLTGRWLGTAIVALAFVRGPWAQADPTPVRDVEGTLHGFLELRAEDGRLLASGDLIQVVRGDRVTAELVFRFKDGSVDDETTVYSERHTFRLISDRHIQKGPYFPHPMDTTIDAASGEVTVRTTDKDGKEKIEREHVKLPADLVADSMVRLVAQNARGDAGQATASLVVATPKPRLVKLEMSRLGEDEFSVGGSARKEIHYQIKIDLGGIAGVVAPLIGKEPPDLEIWTTAGEAPTFVREEGPLYPEGPMATIELAAPAWPDARKAGE